MLKENKWAFLNGLASSGNWKLLELGDVVAPSDSNSIIVIGVALWAKHEIETLHTFLSEITQIKSAVFIFDIDEHVEAGQMEDFLPALPLPTRTPIVAQYANGSPALYLQGQNALKWLRKEI